MVTPGNRIADIGTDHGYLPIWLLQKDLVPYAIGMDIRKGPLAHADTNMRSANVSEKMELRLSDGLDALNEAEADTIVISGMGGMMIRSILMNGYQKAIHAKELILSPQSDIPVLRHYLRDHGFRITDETVLMDAGKYYTIIKAIPESATDTETTDLTFEDRYGPVLLKNRPDVFLQMLAAQTAINNEIIHQLESASDTKQNRERLEDLYQTQAEIQSILRL